MLLKIFVYGSLMTGLHNHRLLAPFVRAVEPASAAGMVLLRVTATYPGMVPGEGKVWGELVALEPTRLAEAFAVLDELEDYHGPGHPDNDYDRRVIRAERADGGDCKAWTYIWVRDTVGFEVVPGGDWRMAATSW